MSAARVAACANPPARAAQCAFAFSPSLHKDLPAP